MSKFATSTKNFDSPNPQYLLKSRTTLPESYDRAIRVFIGQLNEVFKDAGLQNLVSVASTRTQATG